MPPKKDTELVLFVLVKQSSSLWTHQLVTLHILTKVLQQAAQQAGVSLL